MVIPIQLRKIRTSRDNHVVKQSDIQTFGQVGFGLMIQETFT